MAQLQPQSGRSYFPCLEQSNLVFLIGWRNWSGSQNPKVFFFVMMVYANTIYLHGRKQIIFRVPRAWFSGFVFNPFKPLLLLSSSLLIFFIITFLFLQIIIILISLLSLSKLWLLLQKILWLFALWLEPFWQRKEGNKMENIKREVFFRSAFIYFPL